MRTDLKVATLSLTFLLGACSRREETTATLSDDLKRDLAAASAPGDLAGAPQSYQRMRFVSGIEQPKTSAPVRKPKLSKTPRRPTVRHNPSAQPVANVADEPAVANAPAPEPAVSAPVSAPMPEPVVIAQRPSPDPVNVPVGTAGDGGMGERRRNGGIGGLGGMLGGIIGAVVIRGGHGGVDKCDPRTDGRNRPPIFDRPDFGMPLPTGQTFPSSRR
jgi:hypothetical protein